MYVCYLDFDGVLHQESILVRSGRRVFAPVPGCSLFEWEGILREMLGPHPDVKIVLSTPWVHLRSFAYAKRSLHPILRARVVGATFQRSWMDAEEFAALPRGIQVLGDVLRRRPLDWFAIDDDGFDWPAWCRNKLVLTQRQFGLADTDVQRDIRRRLARWHRRGSRDQGQVRWDAIE